MAGKVGGGGVSVSLLFVLGGLHLHLALHLHTCPLLLVHVLGHCCFSSDPGTVRLSFHLSLSFFAWVHWYRSAVTCSPDVLQDVILVILPQSLLPPLKPYFVKFYKELRLGVVFLLTPWIMAYYTDSILWCLQLCRSNGHVIFISM